MRSSSRHIPIDHYAQKNDTIPGATKSDVHVEKFNRRQDLDHQQVFHYDHVQLTSATSAILLQGTHIHSNVTASATKRKGTSLY